jgi:hypothetical protein
MSAHLPDSSLRWNDMGGVKQTLLSLRWNDVGGVKQTALSLALKI